jgi:hypothetical protein
MAYTFGAATSNSVVANSGISAGANSTAYLVGGWFYPTTLTAGRRYWALGGVTGLDVGTTTSQIRLTTDRVTTDALTTHATAGITTGKWWFIAVLAAIGSSGIPQVCFWVGDENQPPLGLIVAPSNGGSGNGTSSTNWTIGNLNAGTSSFQGDIGNQFFWAQVGPSISSPLPIVTAGTIDAAVQEATYNRLIVPMYTGDWQSLWTPGNVHTNDIENYLNMESQGTPMMTAGATNQSSYGPTTVSGATWTERTSPNAPKVNWPVFGTGGPRVLCHSR